MKQLKKIIVDPTIKENVLMSTVKIVFGYQPGRKKIRDAKKHTMDQVHGSFERIIWRLPLFDGLIGKKITQLMINLQLGYWTQKACCQLIKLNSLKFKLMKSCIFCQKNKIKWEVAFRYLSLTGTDWMNRNRANRLVHNI